MVKLFIRNNFLPTKIIFLISVFIFILFFSLYKIEKSPPIWYDEGIYNQVAINIANHFKYKIQTAPGEFVDTSFITGGYPFILPIALSFKLFGVGLLQSRLVMVLFILSLGVISFLFIKKLFGIKHGLFALLLFATFPVLYGIGKSALGEIPGMFFIVMFFYILEIIKTNITNKEKKILYILAGIFSGLSVSTKPIFLILIPSIILSFLFYKKSIKHHLSWKKIIISLSFFTVMLSMWVLTQFSINSSAKDVFGHYANPYGYSNIFEVVMKNFVSFFNESTLLYLLIIMSIWIFSAIIRYRTKTPIASTEFGVLVFSITICLAYLRMASWYRYLFPAQIFSLLFLPSSLQHIYNYLDKKIIEKVKYAHIAVVIVFIVVGVNLYSLFFNSWVANHYDNNRAQILKNYFSKIEESKKIFLYNTPVIPIFLNGSNYYQFIKPTESILIGYDQMNKIKNLKPNMIVAYETVYSKDTNFFYPYVKKDTVGEYVILELADK